MDIPPAYLDRIQAILPDLVITSTHFNQDGMVNDVVIPNEQFIARFPKDAHAKVRLVLKGYILELIRAEVEMPVPQFENQAEDVVIYRMLGGEPLTREVLLRQDEAVQDRLAEQLARFLSQLHAIPRQVVEQHAIGASEAVRSLEEWSAMFADVQRELFPFLWAHQKTWVQQLFAPALDRARFRAGALELEWALHAIRSHDASWWLAHIGGARDVMPLGKPWTS